MFVERLYKVCLGRIGDKDGQIDWVNKLIKGQITGSKCAHDFIFSDEYVKKKLSNGDYVKNLYTAIMGRNYDKAGYNDWVDKLKKGMSRDEVFAGFANSTEFDNICKNYGINRGNYVPTDIGTFNPNPYKVGDIIKFGKYEQDDDLSNGAEDIEWKVLAVENNKVLLISRYSLECMPYHNSFETVTWETCDLRRWLNWDFYNSSFNEQEKNKISTTEVINNSNPFYGTDGGNNTKDKIFCLSMEELDKYFGCYKGPYQKYWSQKALCYCTYHANQNGAYYMRIEEYWYNEYLKDKGFTSEVINDLFVTWWLRTPGESNYTAETMHALGATNISEVNISNGNSVRPAMWITY